METSIERRKMKVKVGNATSRIVEVRTGLWQSDALSPILFNLVVEKVIREIKIKRDEGIIMKQSLFQFTRVCGRQSLVGGKETKCDRLT